MKRMSLFIAAGSAALCFAALAKEAKAPKAEAVSINADDLKWEDAPAAFPKGAHLAVLHGNPFAKGLFALRFKMPDGYKIQPHWHTQAEELTILSGTFLLHMGDTMDAAAHSLSAGAYHFLPARMHHSAEAKGEVVLELHGMGPFDIHYLNAADDPTKAAAAK
ncbi:MAG TPA: cupin domain-containing protein [Myxococcales bacterium]|nr:cupin domain-containing protein [Myxococcales bacterium]